MVNTDNASSNNRNRDFPLKSKLCVELWYQDDLASSSALIKAQGRIETLSSRKQAVARFGLSSGELYDERAK